MSKYDHLFRLATRFETKLASSPYKTVSLEIAEHNYQPLLNMSVDRVLKNASAIALELMEQLDPDDPESASWRDRCLTLVGELKILRPALEACATAAKTYASRQRNIL